MTDVTDDPNSPGIAVAGRSVLLVVDIQEAFRGKIAQQAALYGAAGRLLQAAEILSVPVIVTEQYPGRLGSTVSEVARFVPAAAATFEKRPFSCVGGEGFLEHLRGLERDQVIVAGLETHICVSQTVCDLVGLGFEVHVIRDAISSRFPLESELGFQKMIGVGAIPSSVECLLFEWLRDSRSPHFKAVQKLIMEPLPRD